MVRNILRFCNGLITFLVVLVLIVSAAYAGYALWDNQQVYDAVENTMDELREIRALMDAPKTKTGIEALIASMTTVTKEPETTPIPAETSVASTEMISEVPIETSDVSATGNETETPITETIATAPPITETGIETQMNTPVVSVTVFPEEVSETAGEEVLVAYAEIQTDVPAVTVTNPSTENLSELPAETTAKPKETPAAAPTEEPADDSPFGQLKAINPDITAWITMPGTAIDYPVLQGSSNYSYINTDVYGDFALAGSIFLDSRNDRTYQDVYSLLFGHNMSKHRMFSDVNLYKDEAFFNENSLGILIMEDGGHLLKSLTCILTSAGNSSIFNPENWDNVPNEQILSSVLKDAVQINQEALEILKKKMDNDEPFHIVALSTCSNEFTDARTILLTLMDP